MLWTGVGKNPPVILNQVFHERPQTSEKEYHKLPAKWGLQPNNYEMKIFLMEAMLLYPQYYAQNSKDQSKKAGIKLNITG